MKRVSGRPIQSASWPVPWPAWPSCPGWWGGAWEANGLGGDFGRTSEFRLTHGQPPVRLTLFFGHGPSPAIVWHFDWLLRLAGEYYLVKAQHRELQRMAYLQAVYETGARVTHDVKNLLQSMQTLCYAAAQPGDPAALASLLGRQLPLITERLRTTLDKLQRPTVGADEMIGLAVWWAALQERYGGMGIAWEGGAIGEEPGVPRGVFDSVAENLLQNALAKRQREPGLAIRVSLDGAVPGGVLRVADDGSAVPERVAMALGRGPVASEDGLGIGLYHAGRQAKEHGYRLDLSRNEPGAVVFTLAAC